PSMHWGWESGYRFAAMEGAADIGMMSTYEIHSLGNVNYFSTSINKTATERNGKWIIAIDADYTKALKDINVTQNLVSHGDTDEAQKLLFNFRDNVFKPGTILTGINETKIKINIGLTPNPSNGAFVLSVSNQALFNKIVITDITGKVCVEEQFTATSTQPFNLKNKGIYFMQVYNNNTFIGVQKLIVQ
ncbi:MAG: MbnP family protein, partial [Bacteroidia bacterium]